MACCACGSSLRLSSVSAVAFWVIYRVTDLLMDHGSRSGWIKVRLEFDDLAYGGRRSLLQGSSLIHVKPVKILLWDVSVSLFCRKVSCSA